MPDEQENPLVIIQQRLAKPEPDESAEQAEARRVARELLADERYRANFLKRWRSGDLKPQIEQMIWHYAFGTPAKETVQRHKHAVKIEHVYADARTSKALPKVGNGVAQDNDVRDISDAEIIGSGKDEDSP